jgi:hypothetical protein
MTPEIYFSVVFAVRWYDGGLNVSDIKGTHIVVPGEFDLYKYLHDFMMEKFPINDGWIGHNFSLVKLNPSYSNPYCTHYIDIRTIIHPEQEEIDEQ